MIRLWDSHKNIAVIVSFIVIIMITIIEFIFTPDQELMGNDSYLNSFDEGWTFILPDQETEMGELPYDYEEGGNGITLTITNTLPLVENEQYLFFRISQQYVKVFIDGKLISSYGWDSSRLFGKTPASAWCLVPLNSEDSGKDVRIEFTGIYDQYSKSINSIYICNKFSAISSIVSDRMISFLLSFILVLIGIGMIIIDFMLKDNKENRSLFKLGAFSLTMGIWSSCTLNLLQVFIDKPFFWLGLEFSAYYMLVPTGLWFLDSVEGLKNNRIMNLLFWLSLLDFFGALLFQITNLLDFMETLFLNHVLLIFVVIYLLYTGIKILRSKTEERKKKVFLLTIFLLIFFILIDVSRFYIKMSFDDGFFTRIGMLLFILLWGLEIARDLSSLLIKTAKSDLLEIIAYEDQMTGLKNRSAFEKSMEEYRAQQTIGLFMVTFDMNDLKKVNDRHGHLAGDRSLKAVSRIIKSEFENSGIAYRVGGDEFCVLIPEINDVGLDFVEERIKRVFERVNMAARQMNLEFSVAGGLSAAIPGIRGIDEAYKEADRKMYEKKGKMKKERLNF